MTAKKRKRLDAARVKEFILRHVEQHAADIVAVAASHFGVQRQTIHRYLRELINDKLLKKTGNTRATRYSLRPIYSSGSTYQLDGKLDEHYVWREFSDALQSVPDNVYAIANHAVTEMVNNAIDHSESKSVFVKCTLMPTRLRIVIRDTGIGIFRKITKELQLNDDREAILELAKGKLTTDPEHHSGQGIFFTSRMVDLFVIKSNDLYFEHASERKRADLLKQTDKNWDGTYLSMELNTNTSRTVQEVFDGYATVDGGFSSTRVPLKLAVYGNERLVSRSQAKRVLTRFERFREVFLDFEGISSIGQAFADEVFRVFRSQYPGVKLIAIHAGEEVQDMIHHVAPNVDFMARGVHILPNDDDDHSVTTIHGLEDEITFTSTDTSMNPPDIF